jgi:2-dehydro-3-deoxyphosphogluconate aldolase/(4S)-4-hydroxy-2-oxoglutarate aldolase
MKAQANETTAQTAARIREIGIIPVVRASSAKFAIQAAEAVCAGGITVIELTMTVPGAIDVISQLAKSIGSEVLIGAGTVLDPETARRCIDAGAEFVVSPGFDLETVRAVKSAGKVMMAGALTPTEVITAWKSGSDFVKVFPCGNVGGAKYIKALKAPLPDVPLVPTGGVNLDTAGDFIRAGAAALGIGSELVLASALNSGNTAEISNLAKKYLAIVQEARKIVS